MKKFLLLFGFLLSNYFLAQNPLLYSYTWQISKILYQNTEYTIPPIPDGYRNTTIFSSTEIKTILYNSFIGQISNINDNQIIVENMGGTLMTSPDENFANFETKYSYIFSIAPVPKTFNYTISKFINGDYELVLTDNNTGNKVYYTASNLFCEVPNKVSFKIYPNPTSDFICIENLKPNTSVKVMDVFGKVLISKKLSDQLIDVKALSNGTYFLLIEDKKPIKFIKK